MPPVILKAVAKVAKRTVRKASGASKHKKMDASQRSRAVLNPMRHTSLILLEELQNMSHTNSTYIACPRKRGRNSKGVKARTAEGIDGSQGLPCDPNSRCKYTTYRERAIRKYPQFSPSVCALVPLGRTTKDCSSGVAWFEEAAWNVSSGADGGRTGLSVQCSVGGICDESTGNCTCRDGMFAGDACDVMDCPTCNDVGECRDMEFFAAVSAPKRSARRRYHRGSGHVAVTYFSGGGSILEAIPCGKKRVCLFTS